MIAVVNASTHNQSTRKSARMGGMRQYKWVCSVRMKWQLNLQVVLLKMLNTRFMSFWIACFRLLDGNYDSIIGFEMLKRIKC